MIGGTGYVIIVTFLSLLGYILAPHAYACDIFLIGALYIALFSSQNSAIFIVWVLGILRGSFSESYIFYPLFFIALFYFFSSFRKWMRVPHPFTQFLIILTAALIYGFAEVLFTMEGLLSMRLFWYWGEIIIRGLLNAAIGTAVFWVFSALPVRSVIESEKGTF